MRRYWHGKPKAHIRWYLGSESGSGYGWAITRPNRLGERMVCAGPLFVIIRTKRRVRR